MQLLRYFSLALFGVALLLAARTDAFPQRRVKQPRDVIEAYRVCNRFQQLFAENLDFDRAFEATFTKDPARRRAIALAEGEFSNLDLTSVDDATLITVYKNEMQLLFLTLLLIDDDKSEASLPARIKQMYARGRVRTLEEFRLYTNVLPQDVAIVRDYLIKDSAAAERIRDFKATLTRPMKVPTSYVVRPITYYSKGGVLANDQPYYQIGDYAVVREGTEMRIIGIRFFSRLF